MIWGGSVVFEVEFMEKAIGTAVGGRALSRETAKATTKDSPAAPTIWENSLRMD